MICGNDRCSGVGECRVAKECPLYKPPNKKRSSPRKPSLPTPTEDDIQEAVVQYCALTHVEIVHIPNEGQRSKSYGARLKRLGLREGFPDLLIPAARHGYHGLMIELKRDRSRHPTPMQEWWIAYLKQAGYHALVCYGAEEAIAAIRKYMG